jgi:hypothetical protein
MKLAILPLLFILTTAWVQPASDLKQVALGQEFEIKVGERVLVENAGLKLSFEAVTEDSRCPEGVTCVWAGNAKVALKVSKTRRRVAHIKLNTGIEPRHKLYHSYDVKLVSLNPPRKKDSKVKQGDYVATLVVSRK